MIKLQTYGVSIRTNEHRAEAEKWLKIYRDVKAKYEAGLPIYVQVLRGDWAGSIAILSDLKFFEPSYTRCYGREDVFDLIGGSFTGYLIWNGRKNKVKFTTHSGNFGYLPDHEGGTHYQRVDKKALAEKIIAKTEFLDRFGRPLNIGDSVIYADIRYGAGTCLEKGKVTEKIVKSGQPHLVITSTDGSTSTIYQTQSLIIKE
jgi:hypothetical protein